jgi:hypothetical protein
MKRTISLVVIICYLLTLGPLSCAKKKPVAPEEGVPPKEAAPVEKPEAPPSKEVQEPKVEVIVPEPSPEEDVGKYVIVKKTVVLQEATPITIELKETCSSETAKQGDQVIFTTVGPTIISDVIAIEEDTPVVGRVVKAEPKRWAGRAGELIINVEYTRAVDGQKVPLRVSLTEEGKDQIAASVVLTVLCCPLFLLMKGKVAECLAGSKYTVYVAADRKVEAIKRVPIEERTTE